MISSFKLKINPKWVYIEMIYTYLDCVFINVIFIFIQKNSCSAIGTRTAVIIRMGHIINGRVIYKTFVHWYFPFLLNLLVM